jgi:hypothetical protein
MKELYKSLAEFQQEVPVIHKGTEGYGYSYADLPAILETINPLLKKHGLGFYQMVNGTQLCTTVYHIKSGESIEGCADIPQNVSLAKMNAFQVLGSAITYMRRYQLSAMLGLVTDKDTDAAGEQKPTPAATPAKRPEQPPEQKQILAANHPKYDDCIKYLKGAGSMTKLKERFDISKDVEEKLMAIVLA